MYMTGKTDIGQRRSSNQDVVMWKQIREDVGFAIVCDGMGGINGGQIASTLAAQTIYDRLCRIFHQESTEYKESLIAAVSEGNKAVYERSLEDKDYLGMGTTVVAVMVVQNQAYIAHVGDSRLYFYREDRLHQITTDHSMVQTLLEQGKITRQQAKVHPQRNMITRALGVSRFVDIDYIEINDIAGAKLLLCTDGLTNQCEDRQLAEVLKERPKEQICDILVDMANASGGQDNITVALLDIE